MEEKFTTIFNEIKSDTELFVSSVKPETLIDQFKETVNDKFNQMTQKLDNKTNELIELALLANEKQTQNPDVSILKRTVDTNKPTKQDTLDETSKIGKFRLKLRSMVTDIDNILQKTEVFEEVIRTFDQNIGSNLIEIKKDDFNFKRIHKIRYLALGKTHYPITWSKIMNKPNNSNIIDTEGFKLSVHANSCYNYYSTDKELRDESVMIKFSTNVTQTNNYHYFGIINERVIPNSNCMCCNIANAWYVQSSGQFHNNAISTNIPALKWSHVGGSETEIVIKYLGSEKLAYFSVNDSEEQGPFSLIGETFRIVSGSCNAANGTITILESFLIG